MIAVQGEIMHYLTILRLSFEDLDAAQPPFGALHKERSFMIL